MSRYRITTLVCFVLVILFSVSCVAYCLGVFDDVFGFFGVGNKSPYNYVKFLDIGEGDATLIHSDGKYVLIDTGDISDGGLGLADKLRENNVRKLDCIIISHDDDDHAGGLYNVLEEFEVGAIVCSKYSFVDEESNTYSAVLLAKEKGIEILDINAGNNLIFGDALFECLWLDEKTENDNDRSLVFRLRLDNNVFFFGGDISQEVERRMLKYGIDVQCDVLKASHHGSNSSTGNEFLDAAKPAYCVISCEADSMYGFPTEQVMSRLHNRNIKTYVTYLDGDIIFNTTEMSVSAKK